MGSRAEQAFQKNCTDIDQLLKIHSDLGGTGPGRRKLEVLNKSAVVLITAFWEAYCEDAAAEGLQYVVRHTKDAGELPKDLRKLVAKELKADLDELAVWRLFPISRLRGPSWEAGGSCRLGRCLAAILASSSGGWVIDRGAARIPDSRP